MQASRLRKKGRKPLLARAAQNPADVPSATYGAATVRERSALTLFHNLLEVRASNQKQDLTAAEVWQLLLAWLGRGTTGREACRTKTIGGIWKNWTYRQL